MAEWLNTTFAGFDAAVFGFMNSLAESAGGFLTPFFQLFSYLGFKGLIPLLAGFCLLLFPKTRRYGFCVLGAVICGGIITNLGLKNIVARPRPYVASDIFNGYWQLVGACVESDFCFPSGHVTCITASCLGFFLSYKKKYAWPALLIIPCMMFARVYLIVHYATDVIGGLLAGVIAAAVAFLCMNLFYRLAQQNSDRKFFRWWLTADVRNLFRKKQPEGAPAEKTEDHPDEDPQKQDQQDGGQ